MNQNIFESTMTTKQTRSKSADFLRRISPMESSSAFQTRSSAIEIDELYRIEKEEQELNQLNHRFASYLKKIIHLGEMNIQLRRQIDNIRGRSMEDKELSQRRDLINIKREMNNEVSRLVRFQTRLQRATYDKKYYRNQLQLFSTNEQVLNLQQQLNAHLYELNLLKEQHKKQIADLQFCKKEYNEYMTNLYRWTDDYNKLVSERMRSEHQLCTLQEQLAFEREKNARCREEWEYLEKIQDDVNDQLTKKEFANIVQEIRKDYQNYNEIQLSELEVYYKIKFESIESHFLHEEKDDVKPLIEENRYLQAKIKQLEDELQHRIEQNQRSYDALNHEYRQLEAQLPEFQTSIDNSRANTVHLTSEINTYRGLLKNLVTKPKCRPADFTVHFGNGIIWCRI